MQLGVELVLKTDPRTMLSNEIRLGAMMGQEQRNDNEWERMEVVTSGEEQCSRSGKQKWLR